MNNFAINTDEIAFKNSFTDFERQKNSQYKKLPVDLIEAINDTRKRKNLHGPFKTAEEAVESMLEVSNF